MSDHFPAYGKLLKRAHEIALLDSTNSLLSWDKETYMPAKALDHRAGQMAWNQRGDPNVRGE